MLVVVRTVTALNRLLDVLPAFADDPRIQVLFTVDNGSAFHVGVEERLRTAGMRTVSWDEALTTGFDLALSASDTGDLHRISAPLMLLLHGVGYHRFTDTGRGREVPGLTGAVRHHANRTLPTVLVVAHPDQVRSLGRLSRNAAASALVAGDPCLDRMLVSQSRQTRYREALGADGRRLVLVNSTWGPHSLLGRHPELPARLLGELPVDEYRVAAVLHPNVWSRHGSWQVRAWLSRALDAGLILVPPDEGWRAAVVAAHAVLSDHGSITCYTAALDKPLLLATDGVDEVVPGSPLDRLFDIVPRLNHAAPLMDQVHDVIRRHKPNRYDRITESMFAKVGESMGILQNEMYRLLRLSLPARPACSRPVPVPASRVGEPTSFVVHTSTSQRAADSVMVSTRRYPAVLDQESPPDAGSVHLVVDDAEPDETLVESAAIIVHRSRNLSDPQASAWSDTALARYPGCRVAAVVWTDRALLRLRDDVDVHVQFVGGASGCDPALSASAIYACLVSGVTLSTISTISVRAGAAAVTARLDVTPARRPAYRRSTS